MPLPTSGPLSLTDIQTEFGGTNPISLNEYYAGGGLVPSGTTGTNGAVPSSGAISINSFYGTTSVRNFSSLLSAEAGTTYGVLGGPVSVITSSNIIYTFTEYIPRISGTTYNTNIRTIRTAANGSVISNLAMAVDTSLGRDVNLIGGPAIDSSDNIYTVGYSPLGNTNQVTKFNSSNAVVWSSLVALTGADLVTTQEYGYQILSVSPNGNVYYGGRNLTSVGIIVGLTSTSAFSWARRINTGSNPVFTVTGVTTDSANNVYATGWGYNSGTGGSYVAFLTKFNSSGTVQWQNRIGSTLTRSTGCFTSSADDTYVYGVNESTSYGYLFKVNSAGVVQWKFDVTSPVNTYVTSVDVDSSGNVYGVATAQTGRIYVFKLNSAGARQWSIILDCTTTAFWSTAGRPNILLDASGNSLIVTANLQLSSGPSYETNCPYVIKIDASGSGFPQTITNSVATPVITTSVLEGFSSALTFSTSGLAYASVSMTYTTVTSTSVTPTSEYTTYTEALPYGTGTAGLSTVTIT
jgi:hypothetical protein